MQDMKEEIKKYAQSLGVDDLGFAAVENYKSTNSMDIYELFPKVKTIVVLAFQQVDNCESEDLQFASVGIKVLSEFSHSTTYQLSSFIKKEFDASVMIVPSAAPINFNKDTFLPSGYVSLRHAAYAAGLGVFGRHNLIIHKEMGSKVLFTAILTDLEIEADKPLTEDLCNNCDVCVKKCPVMALEEENKTDILKCLSNSQPYGFGGNRQFWIKFSTSPSKKQEQMLSGEEYRKIYQAQALGSQYVCFNCTKNCPVQHKQK
jgi:epoxyqueuosine reductase